eukprot:SAG31_NODE_1970_length_6766_cov_88.154792_1_plen_93_part_10
MGGEGRAARLARTFLAVLRADSTVCPAEEFVQKKKILEWARRNALRGTHRLETGGKEWGGMEGNGGRHEGRAQGDSWNRGGRGGVQQQGDLFE